MSALVRRDGATLALLLVVVALQLWPAAGPGRLPESLDLMLQFVPNAAYLQRRLAGGALPLWNPYLGTGMPFAADPGTGAWYLPAWPFLVLLPLDAAVRAFVWLHLAWAAAGTYCLCRAALRTERLAAFAAASSFALTSWLPGLAGMPAVLVSVSWAPWILLLGVLSVERGGRWRAALAAAGALQVVSGWPAGAYLAWLALGIVLVLRGARPSRLGAAVAAGAVALALAGALLVPAAEFIGQTSYADTRSVEAAGREGYLTLLSWLRPAGGSGSLESSQLYAGLVALTLAVVGALDRRRDARAFAALAVVSLVVGLGTRTPFFAALYAWLPGFRVVYLPARLGILVSLATACLAALGLQALRDGRVSARRLAAGLAIVAALLPLTLLQFWQSEGYDNFRRLLTNLGRVTGAPYVGRIEELHYVVASLAAAVLLVIAVSRRAGAVAVALSALVAVDGLVAHQFNRPTGFDPAAWYARALERGATLRLDGDRFAGSQWHGTRHFLTDFPRSADPSLLPPNLALLVGVRDAQGYNPLLLRRAAAYYARLNARETGGAAPDDHWLLIGDFGAPETGNLALRAVASAGTDWRVASRRIAPPAVLRAGDPPTAPTLSATVGAGPVRIRVVTFLGEGTAIRDGVEVGALRLVLAGGELRFPLRAGEHTAEWAYDRADVRGAVAHRQAPIGLQTQVVSAVAGRTWTYEYLATFGASLDPGTVTAHVEQSLPPGPTTLNVAGVWLEQADSYVPSTGPSGTLTSSTSRPRAAIDVGSVSVRSDDPERIVLDVSAPSRARLTLADAFYPGWVARVDGAPADIGEADGLFRTLDVPPGTHIVTFSYEPASLKLGAALTGAGALALAALLVWPRGSLSPATISSRWRRNTSRP